MTLNTSYKTCMPASASQNHGGMRSTYVGCSHGRQLGIGVVRRCDLDDIGGHDVQPVEAPQNRPQLARGPSAGFRGSSGWRECRVDRINLVRSVNGQSIFSSAWVATYIDGQVYGLVAYRVANLFDNAVRTYEIQCR